MFFEAKNFIMKKLKLKKVELAEMPADAMTRINGGQFQQEENIIWTTILISIYTVSVITSGCSHCATGCC